MSSTSPYVEVEWIDIISTSGWEKSEDTKMPTLWSYGYLINHDDEEVRIATTKDEDGEWYSFTIMPIGCVKKITPLGKGGYTSQTNNTIRQAEKNT